ncbi:MAG: SurA N-terminal domain-containing protein [Bdellovibrionota bacterium]
MFQTMRKVFGPTAVTIIIGAIALVFVFFGVYAPNSTQSGGAAAAKVNGDSIPMQEYMREYQQRVEFYQNMMKGKADVNLLRQLGLQQQVIEDLIRRKLLLQEAQRLNLRVSDEELRARIQELPYFKKDGKFSAAHYNQVLQANNYSPASFEETMREDLLRTRLMEFMRGRAKVSTQEIEKEFYATEDRRQVDYVLIDRESLKKKLAVSDKEIEDFLKTEQGLNAAKMSYERNKMFYMKPIAKAAKKPEKGAKVEPPKIEYYSFEEVRKKAAAEAIRDRRSEEATKMANETARAVLEKAKAARGDLKAAAKSFGLDAKTSEKFNRIQGTAIPGAGEISALTADAFAEASALSKEPKLYESGGNFVIASQMRAFKPNPAELAKEQDKLVAQITTRKEQSFFDQWMTGLRSKAKIVVNEALTKNEAAE